ncbi:hypothetical protein ACQRIT_007513 [Beauveria bassiana]
MEVSAGNRLTLTYNLFAVPGARRLTGQYLTLDPTHLPLYGAIKKMISLEPSSGKGGILGFWCSHVYAYNNATEVPLPETLKGVDAALWETFKALGIDVKIAPVIQDDDMVGEEFEKYKGRVKEIPSEWIVGKQFGLELHSWEVHSFEEHNELYTSWGSYLNKMPTYWLTKPVQREPQIYYTASEMAATDADTAEKARASGNEFYKPGQLAKALSEKAYQLAASLAPQDPAPVSNLSAVKYETGDYKGSITYIKQALALSAAGTNDAAKIDKLNARLAKCFLHLRDFSSARDALLAISNQDLRIELSESLESALKLQAAVTDECALRKQILNHVPRFKSWLSNVAEYYPSGHDQAELLQEPLEIDKNGKRLDISLLSAGCGDARNVYAALASMGVREDDSERNFGHLHITMLDLKHAAIAKTLILFNMMHEIDKEMTTKGPHPTDYFLVMANVFACQIIPPFVQKKLQSNIQDAIERLENKRNHFHLSTFMHAIPRLKFAALLPSQALARQWEPSLADTLAEYKKTGKGKKLLQQIDVTWAVNNTLIDYDVADYELDIPGGSCAYLEFDPLEMVSAADFASKSGERAKAKTNNSIDRLADVFRVITISTMKLHSQKRLTVEMIVGEMTDIMERIRYHALEHRRPDPKNSKTDEPLDPTKFPQTYDYIHMSNIPDYIGGHLTTFLVARPLLNDKSLSSLRFNNLLNPPEFENHEAFQSEYLLMHDKEHIKRHFSVRRRPGASIADNPIFKSMFAGKVSSFAFEGDMIWDRMPRKQMTYPQLLPRAAFEKWMHGHFLKICIPYPRPIFSGSPVYAPLNLTAVIHLMISMFEMGYPAHWLLRVFSQLCRWVITTTARPPTERVTNAPAADAVHARKEFSVQPWVSEFTTMLSIWCGLIPFGMDSLGGSLVPLTDINQYSIAFPPFAAQHERLPHFILLFWNTKIGYTLKPPASLYSIFSGSGHYYANTHASPKVLLDKAIVCVTAFQYVMESRSAVFSMRADKMEEMKAGEWRAFIWRTDAWQAVTEGVEVSRRLVTRQNWGSMV